MNILQILPALNSGGVERGTIEIAEATIAAGHKSFVISSGGTLVYKLDKLGAKHIYLPVNKKNIFTIWGNSKKIEKIIKKYNIDIVHARSRVPAWSAYLACKNTKAKFVTTFHGVYSGTSKLKKYYNSVMLKGEKIIAVSNFIAKHIKDNYNFQNSEKLITIHRGVDFSIFDKDKARVEAISGYINNWHIPEDKKIILLPGRITEWKGHKFFLESLALLKNKNYFAIIVGSSENHQQYKKRLEKQIEELNLDDKIIIKESVSDLINLYQISDIIVSASQRPEAFGRVMPEVGAMGKIILATKHGGATETVIDDKTGFLAAHDDAQKFAETIDKILALSEKEILSIGEKAKKFALDNFSISLMQQKTIKLYESLNEKN